MKLTRVSKDEFALRLSGREKPLLLELLKLYPCIPSTYLAVSRSGNLPDQPASQKLIEEALVEQRAENKRSVEGLTENPSRWTETEGGSQISFSSTELDWLLQVLNDIRVGSWISLGSPEEPFDSVPQEGAPHLWAMEMAGLFQVSLIHALEQEG